MRMSPITIRLLQ